MRIIKMINWVGILPVIVITMGIINITGSTNQGDSPMWASNYTHHGGYVDEVWWRVYGSSETAQAMLALESGEIDAHTEPVQTPYLAQLLRNPDIQVQVTLANRYRVLYLNNVKFPLNITGFRRAIAFGMDKYKINDQAIGGSGQPLDSYISLAMTEWEAESTLTTHFYDVDVAAGNASLEAAGFRDLDNDGWREWDADNSGTWTAGDLDDNDSALVIDMWPSVGFQPAIVAATVAQDGLALMGIRTTVTEKPFTDILDSLIDGTFWVAVFTTGLPTLNPTKVLYDEFHSSSPDNMQYGARFQNTTIDSILQAMVDSKTVNDVKTSAKQAAVLLAYEQPYIVCYNDVLTDAWRTDKFDFPLTFASAGRVSSDNHYSVTHARLLNGSYGGILKMSNGGSMSTINPAMQKSRHEANINNKIYEGVLDIDPNTLDAIPRLAYAWEIDPWVEGAITDGAKYTYHLYPNATWHDGVPVTAHDLNFTMFEIIPQTLGEFNERQDIKKVEIPDANTYVLYVNRSTYFEFVDITFGMGYIFPKHIWEPNAAGNYATFEPVTGTTWVGSGPYKVKSRVPGELIKLERSENWHFSLDWYRSKTTTTTTTATTTTATTTTTTISVISPSWEILTIVVSMASLYVILKENRRKY
ncbi:MAG: ABC transporter substrate-binding protein [Candidatus Heimdallarchaeota archaeon]